jgi:hypothetical protein
MAQYDRRQANGVSVLSRANIAVRRFGFGQTARRDAWWIQPAATFTVLSAFVVYMTWAGYQGEYYWWGPYLSPLYAPELFGNSPHAWFGGKPGWWPSFVRYSPALVVFFGPVLFRLTCYYYRGSYYKAFWADPPSCTVGEPRKHYLGENTWPLIIQNSHRYFMYLALAFLVFLSMDVWKALWFPDPSTGRVGFGIGVGTLVLATNVVLIGGYTFGCHSLRHLVGGGVDCLSQAPLRMKTYRCVSCFNRRHMFWAWTSLVWVAFADLYIRMCAMGIWSDWRIL